MSLIFLLLYLFVGVLFAGFCVYLDKKDCGCAILYVIIWPVMMPLIIIGLMISIIINVAKMRSLN